MEIKGKLVDPIKRNIFNAIIRIKEKRINEIIKTEENFDHYLIPGFVNSHFHIESSMLTPAEYAKTAVKHGTVATLADPHEIANVLGVGGINVFIENSRTIPLKIYYGAPPCVPASPFETSGAVLDSSKIEKLLSRNEITHLGEMMNFPGVINKDPEVLKKIKLAKKYNKPVDGHAPGIRGESLTKYIKSGISTDHETLTYEEGKEKIQKGMLLSIREGSAAKNFDVLSPLISQFPDKCMLCTDDLHPDDLINGEINNLFLRALKKGINIFDIIQAASVNPTRHYNLNVGLLQKGDSADLLVINNFHDLKILKTYINGKLVCKDEKHLFNIPSMQKINNFHTVSNSLNDYQIKSNNPFPIILAKDRQLITQKKDDNLPQKKGLLTTDIDNDILKIAVQNRYKPQKPALGFIKNFGLKNGVIASTVAHDSHNLIAVATSDAYLKKGIDLLIESKGGILFHNDRETKILQLPIAGLLTNQSIDKVVQKYTSLNRLCRKYGITLQAPFMTLSFMALTVIPEIKLSDRGLFNSKDFRFIKINR